MWEKQKEWTWANECEFNMLNSHQEPFCCVCSVLRPSAPQKPQPSIEQQPKSSAVLLPETLFGSDRRNAFLVAFAFLVSTRKYVDGHSIPCAA